MKHFKKKGFWVFYVTIVLAGAFIIVALGLQNQSPVIPDVNAQMTPSSISSSYSTDYNILGNLGSYGSSFGPINVYSSQGPPGTMFICDGGTMNTCYPDCGWTRSTCMAGICSRDTDGFCPVRYTGTVCPFEPPGPPPTSDTCYAFCGGSTRDTCFSFLCTVGDNTMLFCATSTTCDFKCLGGGINTLMTCGSSLFGGCGGGTMSTCLGCGKKIFPSSGVYDPVDTFYSQVGNIWSTQIYQTMACGTGQTYGNICGTGPGTWHTCVGCIPGIPNLTQSPAY